MLRLLVAALASVSLWISSTQAAFGLKESGNNYVVDTNAGLVFTVDKTSGDITSMVFNGIETQGTGKHSHISSGIGASCSWYQGGNSNNYIVITCTTSTLIQYYVGRYNDPAIHMMTYTTAEPSIGELRFIARLNSATVNQGYPQSKIQGGTAIEGSDVYSVSGQTHSKFYSSRQFIDDQVHGVTGSSGVGVFMIIPGTGYEGSSGGPFMRDINNQWGDDQELYFYMNSGHTQTESYRQGLHGPYALWFTSGSTPSTYSTTFWDTLSGISGLVTQASRGRVTGKATGFPSGSSSLISIGWSNSAAQYWVRTDSSGNYVSPYMKPGTYTMTLYRTELAIGSQSVTISAGSTGTSNIASTESTPSYIWILGDYDGTPRGFLNADKIETMHPSDSRMSSWGPVTFTVGSSVSSLPMAIFKDIGALTLKTTLTSSQIGARTLGIATTLAFAGGRPQVTVNGWSGSSPAAPTQPDSRGVTRGTWRGNNILYTVNIPSGTLVAGENTIVINVISGSSGSQYLSPNVVLDSIFLY
ncbi:polysaccharide lyase family 4 protein [Cylindrobasidium torrendii FP15055 ss-10]|uniref:rhamnogalacturonan endolyase n=1 Tax=Cylindrobasidium torrendii FP15055 ss-10 TaxID=1314674 RepID=A0A0D7BL36_9AGAR|nr:polysaccharide lyase family 4 protein [Cylindrobasidium torrendii FP15055 ss-10]